MKKVLFVIGNFFVKYQAFFKRLLMSILTLVLAVIFGFICIKLMPGDVVTMYARNLMNARKIPYEDAYRLAVSILNYDPEQNVFQQFGRYVAGLFHGDFGTSMYREDVTTLTVIRDFMPWTLLISGISLLISFIIGILIGGRMAAKRKGVEHAVANSYIVVSGAIPDYIFGMLILIVFAVKLDIFPQGGNYDLMLEVNGLNPVLNVLYHAALPIFAFSFVQTGSWALSMRGSAIGVLGEDYIFAARVRGVPERLIRSRYLRRNAMLPLIVSFALSCGAVFGGAPLILLLMLQL